MCSTFPYIFCFFLYLSLASLALAQSPPQLNINNSTVEEQTVRPGATTTLECPVRNAKNLIFEWYKDNEYIMTYGGQRLRILTNGALKIKELIFDDTGVYRCRAVNGFGSVEFNITLLVMGSDADYELYGDVYGKTNKDSDESKISLTAEPRLLFVTKEASPIVRKPGVTFRLQCVATGYPKPEMMWYKNGKPVARAFRIGRWALKFTNALPTDSGNYTCVAKNVLGKASHSWLLFVDENPIYSEGKPMLTERNTTAREGETAALECGVENKSFTHIEWSEKTSNGKPLFAQWLKRVDPKTRRPNDTRILIPMDGEYYNVLSKPYTVDYMVRNGVYVHKLIIENVQMSDAGKYICLGANSYGYEYRFTFLFVNPKSHSYESVPFPIVVTAIVVGIAFIGGVVACLSYCRPRERNGSRGSSTGAPMVSKEDFIPMHAPPTVFTRSTSKSKPHRNINHSDQQVVYQVPNHVNGSMV